MKEILQSSANPQELSMTIKGAIIAVAPVIIAIFQSLGIGISETLFIDIVQSIGVVISSVIMLVGLLRKAYYTVKQ